MIGAYECFFNMRTAMIFKAESYMTGLFIRKRHINNLFNEFQEFMV